MSTRLRYVVSYNKRARRWFLTSKGIYSSRFRTQLEAIRAGAAIGRALWSIGKEAELIIKAKNGKIRDNRTYGNDPRGTKG
jgi:hypothetical protein